MASPSSFERKSFRCYKTSACCCISAGILLFGIGCAWVSILDALRDDGAKRASALTQPNEDAWKGIPGKYDIDIAHKHYFFSCANPDEVIYQGKQPVVEQYGPYVYREH